MINYKELIKNFTEEEFTQNKINLHIHTTFSDGDGNFDDIVNQAENSGYKYISITDHNTMDGYRFSQNTNSSILIPGVEFDVWCGYVGTEWDIARLFSTRNLKKLIDAIHSAGGIAVLAHPACCWCISMDRFVGKLVKLGLDGIEVYYPYPRLRGILKFHSEDSVKNAADKYNLIKTGGTDCHSANLD